jgi:hypothetical protein
MQADCEVLMLGRLSFAVFILLLVAPSVIRACSCAIVTNGCGMALNPGSVVFLGKVISRDEIREFNDGGSNGGLAGYAFHIRTTENFQEAAQTGQEVVVSTGQGGGDCGYPFQVGTSYLVYATNDNGKLSTSICSGTSPEVMVSGALKELRALRDGTRVDDLFGTVVMGGNGVGFEALTQARPLPNVSVHATSSGGSVLSALTDQHGAYAFPSLPHDTYRIDEDLPAGLSTWQRNSGQLPTVEVKDGDGNGSGCQVDVLSRPDGQISGTVVDAHGNGLRGFVTIKPADPIEAEAAMQRGGLPGDDTEDGSFSLQQLPPGKYRLIFYAKIRNALSFAHPFYWPPPNDTSSSPAIDLGFGQHLDHLRFEVSATNDPR